MGTSDTPPTDPVEQLLDGVRRLLAGAGGAWRGLLEAVTRAMLALFRSILRLVSAWLARLRAAREYVLDPSDAWARADGVTISAAAAIGVRGFAAGLLLAGALAIATGAGVRQAIALLVIQTMWAVTRFVIIAMLVPTPLLPRNRQIAAYLAGLAPYLFGATALLRLAALLASALLTFRGLTGAGLAGRDARTAVVWAFGGQVGVIAFGWAMRGVVALLAG